MLDNYSEHTYTVYIRFLFFEKYFINFTFHYIVLKKIIIFEIVENNKYI